MPVVWGAPCNSGQSPEGQSIDRAKGFGPDICEESGTTARSENTETIEPSRDTMMLTIYLLGGTSPRHLTELWRV